MKTNLTLDDLQFQSPDIVELKLTCEEDCASLLLKMRLSEDEGVITLRFENVSALTIDELSFPFRIGIFRIDDNREKGWESCRRYTVLGDDDETGQLRFCCEAIEIIEAYP